MGLAPPAQEEPREPIRGANVVKLPPTGHDSARVISLVRSSPFDPVRSGQTYGTCLGVKGSQVRILSSRPTRGPLALIETPGQRAFSVFRADLAGSGTMGIDAVGGSELVGRADSGGAVAARI